MIVYLHNIPIDYQKMLLNVSRKYWSGHYDIKRLFNAESKTAFCSEQDLVDCIDLLVDL